MVAQRLGIVYQQVVIVEQKNEFHLQYIAGRKRKKIRRGFTEMRRRRRRYREADIEKPKASRDWGLGRGVPVPS